MTRTFVAMSGGLDSAVAAALLVDQGHDIAGLTMRIWHEDTAADAEVSSAAQLCADLGIPHHVIDLGHAFWEQVIEPFIQAYATGCTPNPCVLCNPQIKFGILWDHARSLGADFMATGHYARIVPHGGAWQLWRGRDTTKDQAYFLYRLGQKALARTLFPLGEWTKNEVRAYARAQGLRVAERPESQDICFLRDGDYRRFLREHRPEALSPGPIYDVDGVLRGEHQGLAGYTIGQRRGLGIAAPHPLYVLRLEPERNALIVGYQESLGCDTLETTDTVWIAGQHPEHAAPLEVQIRYRAQPVRAAVKELALGKTRISLAKPLRDVTPGQSAVLCSGDRILGGGIISNTYNSLKG